MGQDLFSITPMRHVPVDADLVFQLNCPSCGFILDTWISKHVCARCGLLQPIGPHENYFTALGVPPEFKQDLNLLEKRFYELSRALHPDRFTRTNEETKDLSLKRMSFINQAYGTLKNTIRLRNYFLQLEGVLPPGTQKSSDRKVTIPIELTEAWFELQELLLEDPKGSETQRMDFERKLQEALDLSQQEIMALETTYDRHPSQPHSRQILEKLAEKIQIQSYLESMERDMKRIIKNAHSD